MKCAPMQINPAILRVEAIDTCIMIPSNKECIALYVTSFSDFNA